MAETYEDTVPETLDLAERAAVAINALTRCTNADASHATYFFANFYRNPPTLSRQIPLYGKFMESLALMRQIAGHEVNPHVDEVWQTKWLRRFREDADPRPGAEWGRQLAWVATQCRVSDEQMWLDIAEEAARRTLEVVRRHDAYCFFADAQGEMPTGMLATHQGWTLQGMAQIHEATGSEAALEYCWKTARYIKDHAKIFDSEGRFLSRHASSQGPALHFHHNGNSAEALMEAAQVTGDREFAEFAEQSYLWARSLDDSSALVGFFPEYIGDWPDTRDVINCEGCCVADMIELALRMTLEGVGDYWDDVDRYVRNQFAEMQMLSGNWIRAVTAERPERAVPPDETAEDVPERCVGSFGGWSTANDFWAGAGNGIQHCCTGNCTRALHDVWDSMLTFDGGALRVNLLLNRAADAADVLSHVPYEGRVDVRIKRACRSVAIRVPQWVESGSEKVSCDVDGVPRALTWRGRYIDIGDGSAGQVVQVRFPIFERTVDEAIGGVRYTLTIKGNDVVAISPGGTDAPFYRRAHYREGKARFRTVTRHLVKNPY